MKRKNILIIIISIVAFSSIIGLTVYFLTRKKNNDDDNDIIKKEKPFLYYLKNYYSLENENFKIKEKFEDDPQNTENDSEYKPENDSEYKPENDSEYRPKNYPQKTKSLLKIQKNKEKYKYIVEVLKLKNIKICEELDGKDNENILHIFCVLKNLTINSDEEILALIGLFLYEIKNNELDYEITIDKNNKIKVSNYFIAVMNTFDLDTCNFNERVVVDNINIIEYNYEDFFKLLAKYTKFIIKCMGNQIQIECDNNNCGNFIS